MTVVLGIDFGAKNIGLALVENRPGQPAVVRYAATLVAELKPLKKLVEPRAERRRMRRTRKTRRRRLRRLAAALRGIAGAEKILRFCRRRGYSHDPKQSPTLSNSARTAHQPELSEIVSRLDQNKQKVYEELKQWVRQEAPGQAGPTFVKQFGQYTSQRKRKSRQQPTGEAERPEMLQQQSPEDELPGKQQEDKPVFDVSRDEFFRALEAEVERVIAEPDRQRVLAACRKHLNAQRLSSLEVRPPRFDNRAVTRCHWEGCQRRPPRASNATLELLRQTLYIRLKPVFDEALAGLADEQAKAEKRQQMVQRVDDWCQRLASLARRYRKLRTTQGWRPPDSGRQQRGFRHQIDDLVVKGGSGRLRYCREHSRQYVEYFLDGKQIPNRADVADRDIRSRRQKILFDRLWSLIRGRLLPLVGGRIDRIVVERVAFDVLAGKAKDRQEFIREEEDDAYQMYWYGPRYSHNNDLEMLRKEFGGRCAYCGEQRYAELEVEHILPRSKFPFDSYLVIVPACRSCNARKGGRPIGETDMVIHNEAFAEYERYLQRVKVPHGFCTIKKGLLKLLTTRDRKRQGQWLLGMIANNLFTMGESQKAVRPLGRWLAGKLEAETGVRPEVVASSGRHTAVYRKLVLPEYSKTEAKENIDLRNHAVDAVMLSCDFPKVTLIDGKWWLTDDYLRNWEERVRTVAPPLVPCQSNGQARKTAPHGQDSDAAVETVAQEGNGSNNLLKLPKVEAPQPIKYFENDLGGGYFEIKLSAFGWNRSRQSGALVDPVAVSRDGEKVLKRTPAQEVLKQLDSDAENRRKQIEVIAHKQLRALLESEPDNAARNFVRWLQAQTARGLRAAQMSNHPADQRHRQMLEQFVATPVEQFFQQAASAGDAQPELPNDGNSGKKSGRKAEKRSAAQIPPIIGVRCAVEQGAGKYSVFRCDRQGRIIHRYASHPDVREFYVGYRQGKNGQLERGKPIVLRVNQVWRVDCSLAGGDRTVPKVVETFVLGTPLEGRPLGASGSAREFRRQWREALQTLWERLGVKKIFCIRQAAVIEKTNGECFFLPNFDGQQDWMRGSPWKNIRRVYRSPWHYLASNRAVRTQPMAGSEPLVAGADN